MDRLVIDAERSCRVMDRLVVDAEKLPSYGQAGC